MKRYLAFVCALCLLASCGPLPVDTPMPPTSTYWRDRQMAVGLLDAVARGRLDEAQAYVCREQQSALGDLGDAIHYWARVQGATLEDCDAWPDEGDVACRYGPWPPFKIVVAFTLEDGLICGWAVVVKEA